MGIKLRLLKKGEKGQECGKVEGGILAGVKGKVNIKTPFGKREIASDGSLKGGKTRTEPVIAESVAKMSTPKSTSTPKKGSK